MNDDYVKIEEAGKHFLGTVAATDPLMARKGIAMMVKMHEFRNKIKIIKIGELDHIDCLRYLIELLDILDIEHE